MITTSPSSSYWSSRYINGTDRWTELREIGTLKDALLRTLAPSLTPVNQYRILDAGCGALWMSLEVAKAFPWVQINGIDFAREAILSRYQELLKELEQHRVSFEETDFFSYVSDSAYDAIFDFGLFHHIVPDEWPDYVRQINRLLRLGGSLFLHCFHTTDHNWDRPVPGGHVRKEYYCHYHTLASLRSILDPISVQASEIELYRQNEHVTGLYHFVRFSA